MVGLVIVERRAKWQRYWTSPTADTTAEKWFTGAGGLYQDVVDTDYILRGVQLEFSPVGEWDWLLQKRYVEIVLQDEFVALRCRTVDAVCEHAVIRREQREIIVVPYRVFQMYRLAWIDGLSEDP